VRILGLPEAFFFLLLGAALAPVLTLTPILQYMGWFIASLSHEMGHSLAAWFCGCPAFPAIRIDGHAAAFHQSQVMVLALGIMAGLAFAAWTFRARRKLMAVLGVCALVYPAIAFTDAREVLHLFAGHLGELAFAVICVWRAMSGGFSRSPVERGTYAMLGWYLVGKNIFLCGGLIWSGIARAEYASNGSFGLTNDYIRLANDWFHTPVQSIAALMLVVSLLALPLGVLIWRFRPGR
jgi:hypothetical protein